MSSTRTSAMTVSSQSRTVVMPSVSVASGTSGSSEESICVNGASGVSSPISNADRMVASPE